MNLKTSRTPLIAGNWKMFHGDHSGPELATECVKIARVTVDVEIVIAPPYTALAACIAESRESSMAIAAQDVHSPNQGACTGEISAETLKAIGCCWVILGHSERRRIFAESDELVAEKLDAALGAGLKPIVCVGETLAERDAGKTRHVVHSQLSAVSRLLANASVPVAIAYEPVWAIGSGKSANPKEIENVHQAIRGWLTEWDPKLATTARILYGGSVDPDDAASVLACPNVDGALVGTASLQAASFAAIVRVASTSVTHTAPRKSGA